MGAFSRFPHDVSVTILPHPSQQPPLDIEAGTGLWATCLELESDDSATVARTMFDIPVALSRLHAHPHKTNMNMIDMVCIPQLNVPFPAKAGSVGTIEIKHWHGGRGCHPCANQSQTKICFHCGLFHSQTPNPSLVFSK